jgi:ABC-2 type transport system ATP-binding protein
MIAIGSPLDLRRKLGMVAVEMQVPENGTQYRYFPDRATAGVYIKTLPDSEKVVMRESNLEDVFIEITGQKVTGD